MVNAFKATETVRCGDVDYTLAIDIEIIDALEDEFDLGFDELMKQVASKGRVGKTSRLLRGLLSRNHPDLTLDDVGALAMSYGDELGIGMERLFTKASPEAEEAKDENPPKARRGTGVNSSSHGAPRTSRRTSSGVRHPALSS
jgi:hypothetical protein